MDDIDRASEREQELTQDALSKRMPEGPKATGYCLQCGAEFGFQWVGESDAGVRKDLIVYCPKRRWCDSQCRDDWEKANG